MHISLGDHEHCRQAGRSLVHTMDPRVKVVVAGLLILLVSLTPAGAWPAYPLLFSIVISSAVAAELSLWFVLRRSLVAVPFAMAAVSLLFTVPGRPLLELPLLGWPISAAGLGRFCAVVFKSGLSVQVAVILTSTTRFTDLLWALHALHVPRLLVAIISFMYRYLFVLVDGASRMQRARLARSGAASGAARTGGSLAWRARVTGWMVGHLFLRSYERSERVYQAMAARGYRGEIMRLAPPSLAIRDLLLGALPVVAAGSVLLISFLWWR